MQILEEKVRVVSISTSRHHPCPDDFTYKSTHTIVSSSFDSFSTSTIFYLLLIQHDQFHIFVFSLLSFSFTCSFKSFLTLCMFTLIPAERLLSDATKNSGHCLEVLRLIASMDGNNSNPAIRQAAAVHFKNIVKKGWDAECEVSYEK